MNPGWPPSTIWLFDYDLTLYSHEERGVIDSLDRRISEYVVRIAGCTFEEAESIRRDYWERFGTTLAGLRAVYGILPDDFFDFIHAPEFLVYPQFAPQKRAAIDSLSGPKYIFTNGRSDWSREGSCRMGVSECFCRIVGLEDLNWEGKPNARAYERMLSILKEDGRLDGEGAARIVLLDDSAANLRTAKSFGWGTVLVNPETAPDADFIDFQIPDVSELSRVATKVQGIR